MPVQSTFFSLLFNYFIISAGLAAFQKLGSFVSSEKGTGLYQIKFIFITAKPVVIQNFCFWIFF
jgi:hypothetical protein